MYHLTKFIGAKNINSVTISSQFGIVLHTLREAPAKTRFFYNDIL